VTKATNPSLSVMPGVAMVVTGSGLYQSCVDRSRRSGSERKLGLTFLETRW
jgi:hypothetical protein